MRDSVSIKVSEIVLQAPSELLYICYFVFRVWKKYITQLLQIIVYILECSTKIPSMWGFIPPLKRKGEYKSMTFINMHIQESKLSECKEYEEVTA